MTDQNNRMSEYLEGAKHGVVKGGINSVVDIFADPVIKKFVETYEKENPALAKVADAGIRFVIMVGLAEALAMLGPMIGGIVGDDESDGQEKVRLLSIYTRRFAGERLAKEGVEGAMALLPQFIEGFKNIKTEDVKELLEAQGVDTEKVPDLSELKNRETEKVKSHD